MPFCVYRDNDMIYLLNFVIVVSNTNRLSNIKLLLQSLGNPIFIIFYVIDWIWFSNFFFRISTPIS